MRLSASVWFVAGLVAMCFALSSCSGGGQSAASNGGTNPPPAVTSVSVACQADTVPVGETTQCTATVHGTGSFDSTVSWSVAGVAGGNSIVGTISSAGLYTAPSTVPTPFTVNITATSEADSAVSGSEALVIAGTIASTTQTISAASGGTITLPDGSSVTIPANVLGSDQAVTLTELSALPQQPPNQMVVGVGPVLAMKLTQPLPQAAKVQSAETRLPSITSEALAGASPIQFTIVMGSNAVGSLQGSTPLAETQSAGGGSYFLFADGKYDIQSAKASITVDPSYLSGIQELDGTMGNYNSTIPVAPSAQWEVYWDGNQFQRLPAFPPLTCPIPTSILPNSFNGNVLILVHGMASSVEAAFPNAGDIESYGQYGLVLGFDYDWTQRVADNGKALAGFIDSLGFCTLNRIDIEAHSEGVPVAMAAGGQITSAKSISYLKNVVLLAGPIRGTPLANYGKVLASVYLNAPTPWKLVTTASAASLGAILESLPVMQDLTDSGDPLSGIRAQFSATLPLTRVVVVGGESHTLAVPGLVSVFNGHPFDTVIPLDSALGYASGLEVHPLPPYADDNHWSLVSDEKVVEAIGKEVQASATPSLSCTSASSNCEGAQGTTFTFDGQGFSPTVTAVQIYRQDSTGAVVSVAPSLVDNDGSIGSISWPSKPTCSDPTGAFSIFSFDTSENLASNNVMQTIDPGSCSGPFTLTVASSDPATGAGVTVSPADNTGLSSGTTQFALTYNSGTAVTLTAAATANGNSFSSWTSCDTASGMTCTVTMNGNRTVTANYAAPVVVNYTLTVASTNPNSSVSIASNPTDNNGQSSGTTQFTLVYNSGTFVILSAPSTASGNDFSNWSGCDSISGSTCAVAMSTDRAVTANYVLPGTGTVTVTPQTATVPEGSTQIFVATVAGSGTVTWSVEEGSTGGTISASGVYTAPETTGTFHVVATNTADTSQSATATVTVVPPNAPGTISTVAGGGYGCAQEEDLIGDGCAGTQAQLVQPIDTAIDHAGNIYIVDQDVNRVRVVNVQTSPITIDGQIIQPGTMATVVGSGTAGFSGDGGPATSAELNAPGDIFLDSAGNIFISDSYNHVVRLVNTQASPITYAGVTVQPGDIATVAGGGTTVCASATDSVGDGCPATQAQMSLPDGIALGPQGNLYIADFYGERIREVNASTGVISTVAGDGYGGYVGDGGPAVDAEFFDPADVAIDSSGNLFITDFYNDVVRMVNSSTGIITTLAGTGAYGDTGDGGPAADAEFSGPLDVLVDKSGNVYVTDNTNEQIRAIDMQTTAITVFGVSVQPGDIATIAGEDVSGYSGDGGPATSATLASPTGLSFDKLGNLFFADSGNGVIRKIVGP